MSETNPAEHVVVATLDLYDVDRMEMLTVPRSRVERISPHSRYIICKNFDPLCSDTSCRRGKNCKFVHVDLRSGAVLARREIHMNLAWRTLDEVRFERLAAGRQILVSAPSGMPAMPIQSEMLLKTAGSMSGDDGRVVPMCEQYVQHRICHHASQCAFIHPVYIDRNAKDFQRAPRGALVFFQPQLSSRRATQQQIVYEEPPMYQQPAAPVAATAAQFCTPSMDPTRVSVVVPSPLPTVQTVLGVAPDGMQYPQAFVLIPM